MASSVPLILKSETVSRLGRGAQRVRNPSVAVVYSTGDGTVEVIDDGRPSSLVDHVVGRYRYRFEVDLSDHQHTVELRTMPPKAKGGIYHFAARANIGFRVKSPGEVVRRNVRDGLQVVCDYLIHAFNEITVDYAIEDAQGAQNAINRRFEHGVVIDGCVELYLCRARLEPDQAARAYLAAAEAAKRSDVVKTAEHHVRVHDANRDNELDAIEQTGSLDKRARERQALAGRPMSLQDMLALHLESHPDDTRGAMEMIAAVKATEMSQRDVADQRDREMLRFLAERDLLLPGELDPVRGRLLSGPLGAQAQTSPPSDWDQPLPAEDPARDAWASPNSGGATGRRALPGIIPVYIAVDLSAAAAGGVHAINAGLQSLVDAVAGDEDIATVVRLCLLTYGTDAVVQLSAQDSLRGVRLPYLTTSAGPARLTPAFERLADCIPRDAVAFKELTPALRRPQVLFLSAGRPDDERQWKDAYQALTDRGRNPYAPDIIACGAGSTPPQLMLEIAARPELAFVAYGGNLNEAIDDFCHFAERRIAEYGRAVLDGDQTTMITGPAGYRPATEFADTPFQGD